MALQKTIAIYKTKGKFRQAADREKEIATILQQEGGDLMGALEAFEAAGDLYANEDAQAYVSSSFCCTDFETEANDTVVRSHRTANGCFKEAAELAATLELYPRAVKHFELVAKQSLSSALTKYSVKDYYLKAALCWLATGVRSCRCCSLIPWTRLRID